MTTMTNPGTPKGCERIAYAVGFQENATYSDVYGGGGYLYAGVADVAAITGNADYIAAIDRIWEDVVQRKLYLIGSVGQHGAGDGQ